MAESKAKKGGRVKKKKAISKKARKNIEKPSKPTGRKRSSRRHGTTKLQCIALRISHPEMSNAEIADELGICESGVSRALKASICQSAIDRVQANEEQFLMATRLKSLALLDAVIESPEEDICLRVSTAKFLLKPVIEKVVELEPEELIFETIISESGAVTQDVRKLYEGDFENESPN